MTKSEIQYMDNKFDKVNEHIDKLASKVETVMLESARTQGAVAAIKWAIGIVITTGLIAWAVEKFTSN